MQKYLSRTGHSGSICTKFLPKSIFLSLVKLTWRKPIPNAFGQELHARVSCIWAKTLGKLPLHLSPKCVSGSWNTPRECGWHGPFVLWGGSAKFFLCRVRVGLRFGQRMDELTCWHSSIGLKNWIPSFSQVFFWPITVFLIILITGMDALIVLWAWLSFDRYTSNGGGGWRHLKSNTSPRTLLHLLKIIKQALQKIFFYLCAVVMHISVYLDRGL